MSDRKKETEVIGEENRISRYSESFVAFLVSAYSLLSLYFFNVPKKFASKDYKSLRKFGEK